MSRYSARPQAAPERGPTALTRGQARMLAEEFSTDAAVQQDTTLRFGDVARRDAFLRRLRSMRVRVEVEDGAHVVRSPGVVLRVVVEAAP